MQAVIDNARGKAAVAVLAAAWVAACIPVQVQAPDKPIEINLNVNIRQEVVVRLEGAARDLLQDNPDLF
ncbi:MAG: YnbE family lipoprotein [Alphaproteobacteria bacterium]|nr:YnbE family lipoprotein [Alphaproteobacteria bacterium]